jgi:APA family basic amino acid/polyamine antiporter
MGRRISGKVPGMSVADAAPQLDRAISRRMLIIFIVGDILGAGIYTLVGKISGLIGGAVWLPLLIAFAVASLTAGSYAELVGKYPRAAGAALYTHRAFNKPFFTFMVAFAVMMSGVASASTAALAFGGTYLAEFVAAPQILAGLGFLAAVTFVNFLGVSESVKVNLVLTAVEVTGLLIVITVGTIAIAQGMGDPGRAFTIDAPAGTLMGALGGTALGFYALIGFEDSVNLAEETESPSTSFPRALFAGLIVTGIIYMAVSVIAVALVEPVTLRASTGPLLEVVKAGGAEFPPWLFALIALLAVGNTALINMMMASRLLYGMANERIVPAAFGKIHAGRRTPYVAIIFTVAISAVLIATGTVRNLAETTVLLLLVVFAVVNIAVLVVRRRPVDHPHFRTPTWAPVLGATSCLILASPVTGRAPRVYAVAGVLLAIGATLWLINRLVSGRRVTELDAEKLGK